MTTDPSKYVFNHSMLRVKDPQASIKFYGLFGMKQIHKIDMPKAKFSLYFLANDAANKTGSFTQHTALLELTHNYGSENDPNFKVANGNSDPGRGFGHVCFTTDAIQAACSRLESSGVKFQKKLTDGRMKNIAFALDPDGYWVEIVGQKSTAETEDVKETDPATYRFNHTMIRVKSAEKSLAFYKDVMGMKLVHTLENPENKFNLYFLAYPSADDPAEGVVPTREGLLELTWNYGTENDESFSYYDGNTGDVQGFGHWAVSTDDIQAACDRFEKGGARFKKKLTDGKMKNLAFVLDPDGYWIEVIQNEKYKSGGS